MKSRSRIASRLKHPVWTPIGTVVSILALLIAAIAYFQRAPRTGALEIAAVSTGSATSIAATGTVPSLEAPLGEQIAIEDYTASPIDITVRNTGEAAVRIERIVADPLGSAEILCVPTGGPLTVSANYSVSLPVAKGAYPTSSHLEGANAPIDFVVKPASSDRMAITVGPKLDDFPSPYVFVLRLRLEGAEGKTAVTKPIALVTPKLIDNQLLTLSESNWPDLHGCISRYLDNVRSMTPPDAIRSPDFDRWLSGLERLSKSL